MYRRECPTLRIGLAQIHIEPGAPDRNLGHAEEWLDDARSRKVDLALLPEAMDCGWTHPSAISHAGNVPGGPACERVRAMAAAWRMWVCAGLVERDGARLFNAAVLFDPEGALRVHHRKIHEVEFARSLYHCGDRLSVAETPFGRVGVMICADGFVPGLAIGRTLGAMGASLIVSPCAWAVRPDHDPAVEPYGKLWLDSYGPVAREYGLWIAGCSNVGPVAEGEWKGWRCIGSSMVVGPDGHAAARGSYGETAEELVVVDIPLRP